MQHHWLGSGEVWGSCVLGQYEAAYRGSLSHGCEVPGMRGSGPGAAFTGQGTRGDGLAFIRLPTGWACGDKVWLLKIMHGESYACMRHEVWIIVDRTASHHIGASQRCVSLLMLAMKL
jgi:hypothetical protein